MKRRIVRLFLVLLVVAGCAGSMTWFYLKDDFPLHWLRDTLKAPRESGEIIFLTLRGPTTTENLPQAGKPEDESQTGFEHDLALLFAQELGARPQFRVMPSYQALIEALARNRGHVAAAGIIPTVELRQRFWFGPSYKILQYRLILRQSENGSGRPKKIRDLAGKRVTVIAGTPAHDLIKEILEDVPSIKVDVLPANTSHDVLLGRIINNESDYTFQDYFAFLINRRLHPELTSAFNVGRESKVAWMFAPQADIDLRQSADLFFEKIRSNGTLNRLIDRYYGHVERISPEDAEAILEKIRTVLPKLRPFFHEAQQISGIDWRILAAVGYQESHWDALATSPTGVRGLMMLTDDTADRMGVKNRLDSRESIIGGAKYLTLLRDTVPPRIPEPDRTWMALAAYNQGYGHLEDARILTQRMKLNADSWLDVRRGYLKLRDPEVYETLKHGFARGDEAVQFVENIRNYTDILNRLEKAYLPEGATVYPPLQEASRPSP